MWPRFRLCYLTSKGLSSLCKGSGAKGAAQDVLITDSIRLHTLQSWSCMVSTKCQCRAKKLARSRSGDYSACVCSASCCNQRCAHPAVMIDGAHAVGAMPLNVPSLGAHFYTSNLHKWHCTAKPSAFLWGGPQRAAAHGASDHLSWLWPGAPLVPY